MKPTAGSPRHEDLNAARRLAEGGPARLACFLTHLALEKAIKAVLLSEGTAFRKVHDLFQLRGLLHHETAGLLSDDLLATLNPWTTEGRYPGDLADATDALAVTVVGRAEAAVAALSHAVRESGA